MRAHTQPFDLKEGSRKAVAGEPGMFYCEVVKKSGSVIAAGEGKTPDAARKRLVANLPLALWTREDIEHFFAQYQ